MTTTTRAAANRPKSAPDVTRLLLSLVFVSVLPVPTVVDISLVCVDCRQFVGVVLEYSVMTVVVVGDDGVMVTTKGGHVGATMKGGQVGVIVTTGGA